MNPSFPWFASSGAEAQKPSELNTLLTTGVPSGEASACAMSACGGQCVAGLSACGGKCGACKANAANGCRVCGKKPGYLALFGEKRACKHCQKESCILSKCKCPDCVRAHKQWKGLYKPGM